ncbi:MAG: hypothetical protein WCH39_08675, partial [Schlesneria sp.]
CQPDFADELQKLFNEMEKRGYGADVSNGKGEFECVTGLVDVESDFHVGDSANACVSLSTFQPGPNDSTDGDWELFVKYGKLGPDFGLENPFKCPMLLFRPGAVFSPFAATMGRAIPMVELLSKDACSALKQQNVELIHSAFAVTLPVVA